ncbi:hypothetical protein ACFTZK_19120 [Streptomyces decoyicus]|uniref:hypothetical protein n=1 Tax=Streptomyces decoyicus TaxID=249567 RepID=UPI00363F8BCA
MAGPHVIKLRRRYGFQSSTLSQAIARTLLARDDWFDELLAHGRDIYRERAELTVRSLREAGDHLEFDDPAGGFSVWAKVRGGVSAAERLAERAREAGIVYSVGTFYDPLQLSRYADHLRLAYSAARHEHLVAGLDRLTAVLKSL